jgi:hypothetical protein
MTELLNEGERTALGAVFGQALLKVAEASLAKEAASPLLGKLRRAVKRPIELVTGSRADRLAGAAKGLVAKADALTPKWGLAGVPQKVREVLTGTGAARKNTTRRQVNAALKLQTLADAENMKVTKARLGAGAAAVAVGGGLGAKKLMDVHRRQKESAMDKEASFYEEALATKIACARELLLMNAISAEMAKSATVSPETARRAMDRLSGMEEVKPGVGQVARYAGIGGGGGAAIAALGNVIEGYRRPTTPGIKGHLAALGRAAVRADKNPKVGDKIRSIASTGVKGALGAGVIPLARSGTDRASERRVLKKYIAQHAAEQPHA